jgi:hypothetical protein
MKGKLIIAVCVAIGKFYIAAKRKRKALIFLDWDNTILPTFEMKQKNISLATDRKCAYETLSNLPELDRAMVTMFKEIHRRGKVVIVTNAQQNWVEFSCNLFLPCLYNVINSLNIPIISAQTRYFELVKNDQILSKQMAFESFDLSKYKQVISIGDSNIEFKAMMNVLEKFKQYLERPVFKTVKLADEKECTVETLIHQSQNLPSIVMKFFRQRMVDEHIQ